MSCSNTGIVTSSYGSKDGIGGIAGRNGNNNTATESGAIVNCYNRGNISDSNGKWVGGITGFQNSLSYTKNCYSTGTVAGVGYKNAIVGNNEGTAEHNYATSEARAGNSGSAAEKGTLISSVSELLEALQSFDTITMGANPSTMLVNPITVACQSTASTITVAVPETGITFTLSDCAKISPDNSDYETALDNSGNIILK